MDESESVLLQLHCAHWFHDELHSPVGRVDKHSAGKPVPAALLMDQHEALDQDGDHGFEILENHEPNTNFA